MPKTEPTDPARAPLTWGDGSVFGDEHPNFLPALEPDAPTADANEPQT